MGFDISAILHSIPGTIWALIIGVPIILVILRILKSPKVKGAVGEGFVSHVLKTGLNSDYRILNDIYLPLEDGTTTQIDHIVVSRYGIFAVETKNYSGWIFADAKSKVWTQSLYRRKSKFQNPMHQNYRHICAIADNLKIEKSLVKGVVAFIGSCEFKTERPEGVVYSGNVADYILTFKTPIIHDNQVAVLTDAIKAWNDSISKETKAAHIENLRKNHLN